MSPDGITRRNALQALAAGPLSAAQPRPNLLFILADDHAGYALGCDGHPLASTPNLDRLASTAVRFASHYCNSPVCTPSRQCLLTGLLPHAAGVTLLSTPLDSNAQGLAKQLRAAGYETAVFGKMHFNRPATAGLHGFDYLLTENELKAAWMKDMPEDASTGAAVKPPWRPFRDPARIWLNADKLPYRRHDARMKSSYLTDRAVEYIETARTRPFALWVSFMEPHSPFDFPLEDVPRFQPRDFPPPPVGAGDGSQIPLIFRDLALSDKQGIAASYFTSVAFLDRNAGRVLDALRTSGLESNTVVVYTADHGYCLGQHGRFEKHCGYDPALRVPLLIRGTGGQRARTVHDLTEHVDLTATIRDLMSLPPLPVEHGRSLRPYLDGQRPRQPRDHLFSEYLENEEAYIRTDRWKFVFCSGKRARQDGYQTADPTPGRYRRLYDLEADPGEFQDVSESHARLVSYFEELMLHRFRATHPGRDSEPKGAGRAEAIEFYLRPRDA